MHTLLSEILKNLDKEDALDGEVLYMYLCSYPNYSDEILTHVMKSDLYELPY